MGDGTKEYSTNKWEVITLTEDRTAYIYGENTQGWAECYFSVYGLSAYPFAQIEFEWIKEGLSKVAINEGQKKYLQSLTNRTLPGYRWWDMAAIERHTKGKKKAKVWLVEIKTHQISIETIKSLQETGKMPSEEQIVYEKSLGFGHLIISVQLVTRRQVGVSCQEI